MGICQNLGPPQPDDEETVTYRENDFDGTYQSGSFNAGKSANNWEVTDPDEIDNLVEKQRKRLTLMGKKVGKMDYKESKVQQERLRKDVETAKKSDKFASKKASKFEYVCMSKKGFVPYDKDKKNQDSILVQENLKLKLKGKNEPMHFFGVADGHGVDGHHVSEFVANKLPEEIEFRLADYVHPCDLTGEAIGNLFRESILAVSEELLEQDFDTEYSGTTLVCSILYNNWIYTANLGDSQGIMILEDDKKRRTTIELNYCHKPDLPEEAKRIEKYGGIVKKLPDLPEEDAGPYRIWEKDMTGPGLAMSRSLGDEAAHILGCSSVPSLDIQRITKNSKLMVWGSDGVFEFLTPKEVAHTILKFEDNIAEAAKKLVSDSVRRWRIYDEVVDDISVVVVRLPH